jgi:hypothetical protein
MVRLPAGLVEAPMIISTTCAHCKFEFKAQEPRPGAKVTCPRCKKSFTPANASVAAAMETTKTTFASDITFWIGLVALALGVVAFLLTPFQLTLGVARALGWVGVLLGGTAAVIAFFREDCAGEMPIAGMVTSVLSLAVVILWIGAHPLPGGWTPGTVPPPREDRGPGDGERRRGPWQGREGGEKKDGEKKDGENKEKQEEKKDEATPPAEPAKG